MYTAQNIHESIGTCINSSLTDYDNLLLDDILYITSLDIDKFKVHEQYVNFKLSGNPFIGYNSILLENNGEYVNKNRNISFDIDTVKHDISFIFKLQDWQFKIENGANNIACAFIIPNVDDNGEMLIKAMKQMGWYKSRCVPYKIYNRNYVILKFEPLYELDVTNEIHQISHIYHISPKIYSNSIKSNGFIPQFKNDIFEYPDRIHFIKGPKNEFELIDIAMELYSHIINPKTSIYNIYTLDTNKIPKFIKFQNDPNFEGGIFTYQKVSYNAIVNVETEDLSEYII